MHKKLLTTLCLIPLLMSCGTPDVDVDDHVPMDYTPTLPSIKDKSEGTLKEDDDYVYFDFYEISDFHGAVEYDKDENMLGLERLSSYYDAKRVGNEKGTILLSGGDMFQGTADSNITRGNLVTYAMNIMNFASMTLGNHEFDWTVEWLKNNKERASFPFLAANLIDKSTNKIADFVSASTIVSRGDYKIGIVGTIGENIKDSIIASAVSNFDFAKEVDTVISETKKLREEGCDIVVWSSHNDVTYLKQISSGKDLDVDLIFGGHSHTTYSKELSITKKDNEGVEYTKVIPLLESKDKGRSLPHAQLKLDKKTKIVSPSEGYGCDQNPTSEEYSADADITSIYDQYKTAYINPSKNRYMGKLSGDMSSDQQLANLAVKVMFEKIKTAYPDYECRAAFTNVSGGIRAHLKDGDITYGDIYSVFPFDNEIVVMETNGKSLKNYASSIGLNVARYQNIYKLANLVNDQKYLFITTDYLASHVGFFARDTVVNYTKINVRDEVATYFKKNGTIKADDYKTSAASEFQTIR